ncbi:hypothetical protein KQI68_07205 [Peptoniphilus sp. MSJ-1]|uniref:Uncharacterized protein n=1 Tax=Peptoniphilus ovalis TaxID=2841503 RepID=A0ABS6FI23_9FIRM|nr:hypothetical protein [Peptoniphilus ovalis]MBU5669626.1 hypothetical protein [Peptoniphilus ovalis]
MTLQELFRINNVAIQEVVCNIEKRGIIDLKNITKKNVDRPDFCLVNQPLISSTEEYDFDSTREYYTIYENDDIYKDCATEDDVRQFVEMYEHKLKNSKKLIRDLTIVWLENNKELGFFDGYPEEDMDFSTLSDEEIKYYYQNWVKPELELY